MEPSGLGDWHQRLARAYAEPQRRYHDGNQERSAQMAVNSWAAASVRKALHA